MRKMRSRPNTETLIEAKRLLESEGYIVAARSFPPHYSESGTRLNADWVAFRVHSTNDIRIQPNEFCEQIGISQKTFIKRVKQSDCPEFVKRRGPKGRLDWLIPNQELVTFLVRNKRG